MVVGVSMKLGVVVWVEGTTVKFRINEQAVVERGQLVKVVDKGRKFILRVYDFRPESLLSQAEIAIVSKKIQEGEPTPIYDKSLRLYDTALATIICQISEEGIVHGPTGVPSLFTDVETLDKIDLEHLNLDTGDIVLGYVRVGHRTADIRVTINGSKVIPHHILVCGVTGSGKSNLGKVLAASIMAIPEPRYSMIIFDCESEYFSGASHDHYGLVHLPEAEERLFYVTTGIDEPCKITYEFYFQGETVERKILAYPLKVCYSELTPRDFSMTGEFSSPQEELLWLLYKRYREDWLEKLLDLTAREIYEKLGKLAKTNTINVTKRKVKHMLGDGDIFIAEDCPEVGLSKAVLAAIRHGKIILIDIPHATEGEEKLLSVMITRKIFRTYELMRKTAPDRWAKLPYVLIMVEEAHRYLAKHSLMGGEVRENIFSIISKRGRKYKVGALYITQMPGEIAETVIRQTLTKIILPLPTRPDYTKVIQYSPYLDEAEQEIKTLDRGDALIVSPPSGLRFAVPAKVFSFEKYVEERLREKMELDRLQSITYG
ncbi:MAG: hypothetical protein DRJ39_03090 [Thermoprotei archaeon]|nr:MAG: hypothetical protein DRJ39_03090 [Thermoprotei archaeon]